MTPGRELPGLCDERRVLAFPPPTRTRWLPTASQRRALWRSRLVVILLSYLAGAASVLAYIGAR